MISFFLVFFGQVNQKMPILKERQGVGIYSALLKQNGGNSSFSASPTYKCALSRVQAGSGFLRNTFNRFKNFVVNSNLAKNIGQEVVEQAKREIPAILTGEKNVQEAVQDAVSSKNILNTIKAGVKKTIQSGSGQAVKRKLDQIDYAGNDDENDEDDEQPVKRLKGGHCRIPQKSKMRIKKKDIFEV